MKKCTSCKEIKGYSEFYKNKSTEDGFRPDCKKCANISSKKWNGNNREKVRLSYNYWNTGVKPELYKEFLELQNGLCAICGKTNEDNKKNLAVDHDHKTGKIRGLLCNRCNIGIGYLEDNIKTLKSAAKYLYNPPLLNKNIDYKPRKKSILV